MIFGEHIYFEGVDITKNCTTLDFYHTNFWSILMCNYPIDVPTLFKAKSDVITFVNDVSN